MGILVSKTNQPTFMFKLAFFILPSRAFSAHCPPPIPSPQCCVAWILSIHWELWLVTMTDGLVCGLHVEWHSFPPCLFWSLCRVPPFLISAPFSSVNLRYVLLQIVPLYPHLPDFLRGASSLSFLGCSPIPKLLHCCLSSPFSLQHRIQPPSPNQCALYLSSPHFWSVHCVTPRSVSMHGSCWEKDRVMLGYWSSFTMDMLG